MALIADHRAPGGGAFYGLLFSQSGSRRERGHQGDSMKIPMNVFQPFPGDA